MTCSFKRADLRQKTKQNNSSPCHCRKVTIHQDDCVINNGCDLFCATYHDVIGAAPFSVCSVPLTAFFSFPPILPFPILCLIFGWPLFLGKGPLFPWKGRSFRERLDPEELVAAAGGWLPWQGSLAASPARLAAGRAHPTLSVPAPLPVVGWMEASARPSKQTFPRCCGQPGNPASLGQLVHSPSTRVAF